MKFKVTKEKEIDVVGRHGLGSCNEREANAFIYAEGTHSFKIPKTLLCMGMPKRV